MEKLSPSEYPTRYPKVCIFLENCYCCLKAIHMIQGRWKVLPSLFSTADLKFLQCLQQLFSFSTYESCFSHHAFPSLMDMGVSCLLVGLHLALRLFSAARSPLVLSGLWLILASFIFTVLRTPRLSGK